MRTICLLILLSAFFIIPIMYPNPVFADPAVSSFTISDVTSSSFKITIVTDEAVKYDVLYGTTPDYGSTKSSSSYATTNEITVSDLSANTSYYFQVNVDNESGGTGDSGQYSVVTAVAPASTASATATPKPTVGPTSTPTPTPDRQPPALTVSGDFSETYSSPPEIKGKASDVSSVALIEYSIDGEKSYVPVDSIKKPGSISTDYSFVPAIFEDGNFTIRIRAKDSLGNIGAGKPITLVIDRLPPAIGPALFSIGSQILLPMGNGNFAAPGNLPIKVTLSAVGGATDINLIGNQAHAGYLEKFTLTKNSHNGLWSADLTFPEPGRYTMSVGAIDGASQSAEMAMRNITILPMGQVVYENTPAKDVTVTIYSFQTISGNYTPWNGKPYGQNNPVKTDDAGRFIYFLPAGTYYLETRSPGFNTTRSNIFTVTQNRTLNPTIPLMKAPTISFLRFQFSIPWFSEIMIPFDMETSSQNALIGPKIVGTQLPAFVLKTHDAPMTHTSFRGKPTVLTFLTTWSPLASRQLTVLEDVSQKNPTIHVAGIMVQETIPKVELFAARGGYSLKLIADPDGIVSQLLSIDTVPTHFFLDRRGVIQHVKLGVLNEKEILDNLK